MGFYGYMTVSRCLWVYVYGCLWVFISDYGCLLASIGF